MKEKAFHATFAVTLQTAEVMATVHSNCSVQMEKALHLWVDDMNRKHVLIVMFDLFY
jgi:predicted MFS family arabinose efflux permease